MKTIPNPTPIRILHFFIHRVPVAHVNLHRQFLYSGTSPLAHKITLPCPTDKIRSQKIGEGELCLFGKMAVPVEGVIKLICKRVRAAWSPDGNVFVELRAVKTPPASKKDLALDSNDRHGQHFYVIHAKASDVPRTRKKKYKGTLPD